MEREGDGGAHLCCEGLTILPCGGEDPVLQYPALRVCIESGVAAWCENLNLGRAAFGRYGDEQLYCALSPPLPQARGIWGLRANVVIWRGIGVDRPE